MKCELCGKDYIALGVHLRHKHQVAPADYREEYGLMKTTPLVSDDLSKQLSAGAKARLLDPDYLLETQERCRANAKLTKPPFEMSEAGKQRLANVNMDNNRQYLKGKASPVANIIANEKTAVDVRRRIGMGANAVKAITAMGLAAYDVDEAKKERARRAALTHRKKALERVSKVEPLLETTASAAEMCRRAGISIKTYKNWLKAGLIRRHPNGFGPRK